MNNEQNYTFGETDRAALRLERLAELYRPALVDFVTRAGYGPRTSHEVRRALDLGSGPGHTTRTLSELLEPAEVIGLDRSARFVELARDGAESRARFLVHDVTEVPFPTGPAELAYSRFLLTHLARPQEVLRGFGRALAPGGRLLLQEVAELSSDDETLGRYYELVARLQANYGQEMHIGKRLDALAEGGMFRVVDFRLTTPDLPVARLAKLHAMNLETWKHDAFARSAFEGAELERLSGQLAEIAEGRRTPNVRHRLGELVLELS